MAHRVTEKDLNQAAKELSELTGEQFSINFPNRVPTLYVKGRGGHGKNPCFAGSSNLDLLDQIARFQAGIQYGLNMTSAGKHPDLKDPKKALARINGEIKALIDLEGDYQHGFKENLYSAEMTTAAAMDSAVPVEKKLPVFARSCFQPNEQYGTQFVHCGYTYVLDGTAQDQQVAERVAEDERGAGRKARVIRLPEDGVPDAQGELRTGFGIFVCWE